MPDSLNYTGSLKDMIEIHPERDSLLTTFGKETLQDRYLQEGETYQQLFARVSGFYADNQAHAQRLYDYMSKLWFMPSTPILSNGGTDRGFSISCFLNESKDSVAGIRDLWNENIILATNGGGIGSFWGNVRSIGEKIRGRGKTSGIIPFVHVMDSLTLAISQGDLRRGSAAVYLPVWHPEIEEFIEIRRPTGGDPNRKCLNLHHGVVIDDKFMHAVLNDADYALLSPKTKQPVLTKEGKPRFVKAKALWIKMLTTRLETGEPYMLFIDNVNKYIPEWHKLSGLKVKTSNLCAEITLPTGEDHLGNDRTAVCCLSSLNLELYNEWKGNYQFVNDIMRFLDNVLQDFIDNAPDELSKAKYSAMRERSVGLGVMGFHSLLQQSKIGYETREARVLNKEIFASLKAMVNLASLEIGITRGACPDALEHGFTERFSNKMSIAPTATISIICGESSPGIEPIAANVYNQKTLSGSTIVKNKYLAAVLEEHGLNNEEVWNGITVRKGSVQHLKLPKEVKDVFKTAFEIDQRWLVRLASDRVPYICQAQSVNVFLRPDVNKNMLHEVHMMAWKQGLKSLYYCRSESLKQADTVNKGSREPVVSISPLHETTSATLIALPDNNYEICESCQ